MLFYFNPTISTTGTIAHVKFAKHSVYILVHERNIASEEVNELLTKYIQGFLIACSAQCTLDVKNPNVSIESTLYVHVPSTNTTSIIDTIQLLSVA